MDDLRVGLNDEEHDRPVGPAPPMDDPQKRAVALESLGLTPMSAPARAPASAAQRRVDADPPLRVLLVDDHAVVREGLMMVLGQEAGLVIVGEAADGVTALEMAQRLRPDVVLMDVGLPGIDGIETTRRLTAALEGVKVVGLSMHDEPATAAAMRAAGAVDYLSKGCAPEPLIKAIYRAGNQPDGSRVKAGEGDG